MTDPPDPTTFRLVGVDTATGGPTAAPNRREIPGGATFFQHVVEGMRCGIVTVDAAGRILTVNELAREILELPGPVPAGEPVRDALRRHPRLAEVLLDALEMSSLPNRAEMEIRTREDDGRTIGFTISQINGAQGLEGVALFFKDLTQVERQEEQQRLHDRLAALGQMAASIAHDIRNPLASIDVTATLLKRRLVGRPEELRWTEKIIAEVQRLNRTVTSGLEFARPIVPELVPQPLPPVLDAALEEALVRFEAHRVAIERRYDPAAPLILIDASLLRQVFVNLVVNAVEAMAGEGRLVLQLSPVARPDRAPGAVDVIVQDTGPGIAADVQDKIFYPFVTTKKHGSGIGLAMARKIVESHHGLIDVTSTPGVGTAFRLRLPCAPSAPAASRLGK